MTNQNAARAEVRFYRESDILYAENDFVLMAYAVTEDPAKVGKEGWHGEHKINVTYITQEQADLVWGPA